MFSKFPSYVISDYTINQSVTRYSDKIVTPIVFRVIKPMPSHLRTTFHHETFNYIGLPIIAQLPRNLTIKELLFFISPYLKNFVTKNSEFTEEKLMTSLLIKTVNDQTFALQKDYSEDDIYSNVTLSENQCLVFEWDISFSKKFYNFNFEVKTVFLLLKN